MWAQNGSAAGCNNGATAAWEAAGKYCQDLTFATYTDWRLPNAKELFTLVKFEGSAPFIDQTTFPATVSSDYWTSTTYVPNTDLAMTVDFRSGVVDHRASKTVNYYVRCVRAGP